ncbi:DUF1553 domain-containing protein [bacterium]|nr:DUF1553 domain-containing protein [bacterium]
MTIVRISLIVILLVPTVVWAEVDYERDVKPLLKTKCWACHGPLKQESGLRVDAGQLLKMGGDSGPAVMPGNAAKSLLLERVSSTDELERMPPEGERLTRKQVEMLRQWVDSGAKSPANEIPQLDARDHWAFQEIRGVSLASDVHPVDFFVERKLRQAGLKLASKADPKTLLRRLYLSMHGLLPSVEEVAALEANSKTFDQAVDRVLGSDRYGERLGQYWLDIVRYADTHGFEVNTARPNAWPYRDYVIRAFNQDKPYDQFVREQIAGDIYGEDVATGFLVAAAVLLPGQIGKDDASKRLARQDSLDEIVVGTSATFLGLTLGCARCHDHKFDPLTQEDYYSMQSFFAGVRYGDREVRGKDFESRQSRLRAVLPEIEQIKAMVSKHEPVALASRTLIIDEADEEQTTHFVKSNGPGKNPSGAKRGYADDVGSINRLPNFSQGYTWWNNVPGQNVMSFNPEVEGKFNLWISWGAHGSGVHTRDARFILDLDGKLDTTEDQKEIATIDQYFVRGQSQGETERVPLWSGLLHVGQHQLNKSSRLVLRGGETGTGVTADVLVLQETKESDVTPKLRTPVNFRMNTERFEPIKTSRVRFTSLATTNGNRYEPCIDELEVFAAGTTENIALASLGVVATSSGNYSDTGKHQLKHVNDGRTSNDRSWISSEKGKGWVQLEFDHPIVIDRIVWGRDRTGSFKDRLPVQYKIEVEDDEGNWKTVAASSDRLPFGTTFDATSTRLRNAAGGAKPRVEEAVQKLKKLEAKRAALEKKELAYAGIFSEPDQTHLLLRGDPEQPTDIVKPRVPALFGSVDSLEGGTESKRRETLARWLTKKSNPLTARVIVNRVWQFHFGIGLVETSSDFGLNGTPPSHPQLLDWLANDLMENDWSLKHLHKRILSSRTWQQSNRIDMNAKEVDADCRLLWRYPARRIEAEVIRDTLLQVSGQLTYKMGGPGFDFFKSRGGLSGFPPVQKFEEKGLRRMVYAHKVRMEPVPIFGAFDCPDAGQPAPVRSRSTTAIQALNLFNSEFVADAAVQFSDWVHKDGTTVNDDVVHAYRRIFQREPSATELELAVQVVEEHGLPTLARVLFNSNEFLQLP